jgi:hypothetical protein
MAVKAEISELDTIRIVRRPRLTSGRRMPQAMAQAQEGKLVKPIEVDIVLRSPYPKVGDFVAELYRSPLSFGIETLDAVERGRSRLMGGSGRSVRRIDRRATPRGMEVGDIPPDALEGMDPRDLAAMRRPPAGGAVRVPGPVAPVPSVAEEAEAPEEQLIQAHIVCQVSDFTLDLAQAKFEGPKVSTQADLKQWLEARRAADRSDVGNALWRRALRALATAKEVREEGEGVTVVVRDAEHFDQSKPAYTVQRTHRDGMKAEYEFRLVVFEPEENPEGVEKASSDIIK